MLAVLAGMAPLVEEGSNSTAVTPLVEEESNSTVVDMALFLELWGTGGSSVSAFAVETGTLDATAPNGPSRRTTLCC